ncbi:hypothetical protein CBFG_02456 [Clostridiales bacterium 1_7_47FAA]|nr:hypothetical protein CBFG_02456 [Clostridiales bacterium 1_7_47FAA]
MESSPKNHHPINRHPLPHSQTTPRPPHPTIPRFMIEGLVPERPATSPQP